MRERRQVRVKDKDDGARMIPRCSLRSAPTTALGVVVVVR